MVVTRKVGVHLRLLLDVGSPLYIMWERYLGALIEEMIIVEPEGGLHLFFLVKPLISPILIVDK